MSGRGEGYCAVRLPDRPDQPAVGYAGLQNRPVTLRTPPVSNVRLPGRRPRPVTRRGRARRWGRGRGGRRGGRW